MGRTRKSISRSILAHGLPNPQRETTLSSYGRRGVNDCKSLFLPLALIGSICYGSVSFPATGVGKRFVGMQDE